MVAVWVLVGVLALGNTGQVVLGEFTVAENCEEAAKLTRKGQRFMKLRCVRTYREEVER